MTTEDIQALEWLAEHVTEAYPGVGGYISAQAIRDALGYVREYRVVALLLNNLGVPLVKDGKHLELIDRIKELVKMINDKRDSEK